MHDLEKFVTGFQNFQQRYYGDDHTLFDELRQGQRPATLVIGCCDSRADPALLMGSHPGDLFVLRNVANLVPPCGQGQELHGMMAAIQFAVEDLGVGRVIVLGHAQCGGIRALLQGHHRPDDAKGPDFIRHWVEIAAEARQQTLKRFSDAPFDVQCRACEQAAILVSLNNLRTFPWISERLDSGQLSIHGWYFDLREGALLGYSKRADAFLPLVCPLPTAEPPAATT